MDFRNISILQLDPRYEVTKDVRGQVKFLEELDKAEQKRHDEQEREMLLRAAKSRTKNEDPEQAKLKAKVSGGFLTLLPPDLLERETDEMFVAGKGDAEGGDGGAATTGCQPNGTAGHRDAEKAATGRGCGDNGDDGE